ncbi:hypothetical protein LE181_23600 [Streptomyces sp. SCA3-4]|uniref:hypothetical protein n=1 Tax=Streptomyces sichuanensis TaxID=2871810 RepID=UPI001CE295AB|nr:hypothetical protein [Streptomyces sichuanensis]MCA6095141.1 hypothetical protein [Streptomyces sichuanensis]
MSEYFHFMTLEGERVSYRSPLADGRISSDDEEVRIVYDPKSPHRRARTEIELGKKSPARRDLGCGILLLVGMNVMILPFVILFSL